MTSLRGLFSATGDSERGGSTALGSLLRIQVFVVIQLLPLIAAASTITVKDIVSMTQLIEPNPYAWSAGHAFAWSPDRKYVAWVTRRGQLETGTNAYRIELVTAADIRSAVSSTDGRASFPERKIALTFETSSSQPAIDKVRWAADSKRLFFIGRPLGASGQVYELCVASEELRQITRHANNIVDFSFSADATTFIYSSFSPPDWRERNALGYVVGSEYAGSFAWTDPKNGIQELHHYVLHTAAGKERRVTLAPARYPQPLAMSHSGSFAIAMVQVKGVPYGWDEYGFIERELRRITLDEQQLTREMGFGVPRDDRNSAFGSLSGWLTRHVLVDTKTGQARALLNAPVRARAAFVRALWRGDDRSVLLAPTYLPLTDSKTVDDKATRQNTEFVAELHVSSGVIRAVTQVPQGQYLADAAWLLNGDVRVAFSAFDGKSRTEVSFTKIAGVWKPLSGRSKHADNNSIRLSLLQDVNTAYDVAIEDPRSGRKIRLTEFNPQLNSLSLGTVKPLEWTDRLGRSFRGGLLAPSNVRAGELHPVVIQTYGYSDDEFLLDGPHGMSSAYAARPLAAAGMFVLQMPEYPLADPRPHQSECRNWADCGEDPEFLAMLEGAIDQLSSIDGVDTSRVGLIGFSREGMHVHYAITFSKYPIAAATICDSIAATPFAYSLVYGFSSPGMTQFEDDEMMSTPFFGSGIKTWMERSPAFHLDRITAALRIELIGAEIPGHWDTFSILKRLRRPAEMIHIPLDDHNLQTPRGRYLSQQGNVDWFRFWLLGEEDGAASKQQQYIRWRQLREDRERASGARLTEKQTKQQQAR